MSTLKSSAEDLTLNADGSGNDVIIQSNGSTKAIVTAEGTVGIGAASSNHPLQVKSTTSNYVTRLENDTAAGHGLIIQAGNSASTYTLRCTNHDATVDSLQCESAGDVNIPIGNLVIGTNGKGIDFSAQTATATGTTTSEILDSYEEGNWTGSLTSATPPSSVPTATGTYVKIGRQVTVNIIFSNKNTTGGSGKMYVSGLPFTAAAGHVGSYASHSLEAQGSFGSSYAVGVVIEFLEMNDAAGWGDVQMVAGSGKYLNATVTYQV